MKTTIYCAVIFFHGLSLLAVADQNTVGPIAAEQNAAAFLEKYCIQCHRDQSLYPLGQKALTKVRPWNTLLSPHIGCQN